MPKLHQSILVQANKQKIWNAIVDVSKYKVWTEVFTPGSYFEGSWQQGEKMKFLAKDKENLGGLTSVIAENKLFKYISIQHLGLVKNGEEDVTSEEAKKWAGCFENYTFVEKSSETTEFIVDVDVADGYEDEIAGMWQKGLISLKNFCEKPFEKITIQTSINKPIQQVWKVFTKPEYITRWNFASPDWECPKAANDLQVGGRYSYVMAAKDGSFAFDFGGTYTNIEPFQHIESILDDGRKVSVQFEEVDGNILVTETFEAETQNSLELQAQGWQAILNNFAAIAMLD